MCELALYLKAFNIASILLRLVLSLIFGGLIGLERGRRRKAAGFRTYMLVCMGATLTMLIGQYQCHMMDNVWSGIMQNTAAKTDITRLGAQVVNGIGFLGAGSVIVTGNRSVKGLTTAAALWASACMGLVIGAGFYECVLIGFLLIFLCIRILNPFESYMVEKSGNMNLYIEFESVDDVRSIASKMRELGIHIFDIDIDKGKTDEYRYPSAVFTLRLTKRRPHSEIITALFDHQCIKHIEEV